VRLNGCNLQCPLCDTEYTAENIHWDAAMLADHVFAQFSIDFNLDNMLCVITGGEPFRQNLTPFVHFLFKHGIHVQVETNGTLPPSPDLPSNVTVVCSPKAGKVNPNLHPYISAYKYVVKAGSIRAEDGLPIRALDHTSKPYVARPHEDYDGPIYVQPCDEQDVAKNQANLLECIKSSQQFGYVIQMQLHKLLGVA
jgi:organic radical activating enzyme